MPVLVVARLGAYGDGDHASGWDPAAGLHRDDRSGDPDRWAAAMARSQPGSGTAAGWRAAGPG